MKLTVSVVKSLKYTLEATSPARGGSKFYPRQVYWDDQLPGFGVRVFPSGRRSYIHKYRNAQGQQRQTTIGAVNKMPLEEARETARKQSVNISAGADPLEERNKARKGELITDLCNAYIERHARPNKRSWLEDERRNKLYILPAFGNRQVNQIKRSDVARLHDSIGRIKGKPYMANRVREQLSKMFELAKTWGFVDDTFSNPAKGIDDFAERERTAYIKAEHMPILANAIDAERNLVAKNLIWLYLFTGKRKNELLEAKWSDIDVRSRTLKIAKTKNNEVEFLSLSDEAWEILESAKEFRQVGNPYIFPGDKVGSHFVNIRKCWERIKLNAVREGADSVNDVPIHGLRHTFAVWLTNLSGTELGLLRKLLNQKSLLATKVYAKYQSSTVHSALAQHGKLVRKLSAQTGSRKTIS